MKYILVLLLIVTFTLTSCVGGEKIIGKNVNDYYKLSESDQKKVYAEYEVISAEVVKKGMEIMNIGLDVDKMKTVEAEGNKNLETLKIKYNHLQLPSDIFIEFNRFSE